MTPLKTLQKYGLKTDVKSVKERLATEDTVIYWSSIMWRFERIEDKEVIAIAKSLRTADLALLCALAEKGERYDKAIKVIKKSVAHIGTHIVALGVPIQATEEYEMDFRDIRTAIAESEGETK